MQLGNQDRLENAAKTACLPPATVTAAETLSVIRMFQRNHYNGLQLSEQCQRVKGYRADWLVNVQGFPMIDSCSSRTRQDK